ncbi:MAG TPA: dipeptidase PepE [Vicinamibacteria bacterium]|nr:dipeptidase PepE [Vicinamibacteria bacterium]
MRLLLLSNSTGFGSGYLDHAMAAVRAHLSGARRLHFVPFALRDEAGYTQKVGERFAAEGIDVVRLTADAAGAAALRAAEAAFVGGGNTFRLLDRLQRSGLLELLRDRARAGMPYLGASAGTNIAAPTIKTTNDMPIVEPRGFAALGLVPFQINPHYLDADPSSRHMGETREQRLREYLEENETPVLALREGAWLRLEGESLRLGGQNGARIFRPRQEPEEVPPGRALDELLRA